MRKLLLGLLLSLSISPALAQNPQCPTRPLGDNTNACASTAFVQQNALTVGTAAGGDLSGTYPNPQVDFIHGIAISLAGSFATVGVNPIILRTTGSTDLTLPLTGTLATLAGAETFSNKTGLCVGCNSTQLSTSKLRVVDLAIPTGTVYPIMVVGQATGSSVVSDINFTLAGVNSAGQDAAGFRSISRQFGVADGYASNTNAAQFRAGEFHAVKGTGVPAGPMYGAEIGIHSNVAGTGIQNTALLVSSTHTGWVSTGSRANVGILISGEDGFDYGLKYYNTDGTTLLFYVDQAGIILGNKLLLQGSASGTALFQPQAAMGTRTYTLPTANGTLAVSATSPIVVNATTGDISCPTCATGSNVTVGTTTITSGTNTRILYDNAGILGEYTITGTGTVVAMQTSPSFVTGMNFNSGFAMNWNSSDIILTHSAENLAFTGMDNLSTTKNQAAATGITISNNNAGGSSYINFVASGGTMTNSAFGASAQYVWTGAGSFFIDAQNASSTLVLRTGATPTTALTITAAQAATFASTATATAFIPSGTSVPTNGIYLPAANTVGISANSTNIVNITSTGLVAGTASTVPAAQLHANTNTATSFTPPFSSPIYLSGKDGGDNTGLSVLGVDAFGAIPGAYARRANNTAASKTATASGNIGFFFGWAGYQTNTNAYTGTISSIRLIATENTTSSANGGGITFNATPIGSTTEAEVMRAIGGGAVAFGTASSSLALTANAVGLTKMTASASAPGAAGGKLELVCGTNAGTAKLVVYAGTSGTAVTITDNIGAGVTGC